MRYETKLHLPVALAMFALALFFNSSSGYAQGTAFTYQGQLMNGGVAANGSYDFTFTLYPQNQNGMAIGPVVTNFGTPVAAGAFVATLDFGSVFDGSSNWLEIAVRTNGSADFTILQPRQLLTPVPSAIYSANASNAVNALSAVSATSVPAGGIVGTIARSNLASGVAWQTPAASIISAQANTDYLLTNSQQVVITLPASPNVGDIFEVAGVGSGGWHIAQNPGQSVQASFSPVTMLGDLVGNWNSIASSSDGTKLATEGYPGGIWISANSGSNWVETSAPTNVFWLSIASSSNGTRLAAVGYNGLWISSDSGSTWSLASAPTNSSWGAVASSADGTRLVAVGSGGGGIWTSIDSGTNWAAAVSPQGGNWNYIASSADGTKLAAIGDGDINGPLIWTSTNSGTNWSVTSAPQQQWQSITSSADGTKLAAAANQGGIWISSDSGTNWFQSSALTDAPWSSLASSSDGMKLVAVVNGGSIGENRSFWPNSGIYCSTNSGSTWFETFARGAGWNAVASSSDGAKIAAAIDYGGGIWTISNGIVATQTASVSGSTIPGTAGFLEGQSGTVVKLLYAGNGQFVALYQSGNFVGH